MSNSTLESLLLANAMGVRPFGPNSRYHMVETTTFTDTDGETVVHLRRRFVPAPETMTRIREHAVQGGDRLDKLAAQYYGDPELYWQICDANRAMAPQALTATAGVRIVIAMPTGIPGGSSGGG